jgi:hypothetical protein
VAEVATRRRIGPGRVLLAGYAVFVLAAGARSAVQLATHAGRAPLAYGLSALPAATYLVGLLVLLRVGHGIASPRAAMAWCATEFAGVLAVGSASVAWPTAFPDATVWSHFGSGYGLLPLVLPVLATLWLRRRSA